MSALVFPRLRAGAWSPGPALTLARHVVLPGERAASSPASGGEPSALGPRAARQTQAQNCCARPGFPAALSAGSARNRLRLPAHCASSKCGRARGSHCNSQLAESGLASASHRLPAFAALVARRALHRASAQRAGQAVQQRQPLGPLLSSACAVPWPQSGGLAPGQGQQTAPLPGLAALLALEQVAAQGQLMAASRAW